MSPLSGGKRLIVAVRRHKVHGHDLCELTPPHTPLSLRQQGRTPHDSIPFVVRSCSRDVRPHPCSRRSARSGLEPPRRRVLTRVTDLGTLGTIQSAHANDINELGQVVGSAAGRAFLWQNGVMTDLGTLGGNSSGAGASTTSARSSVVPPRPLPRRATPFSGTTVYDHRPHARPGRFGQRDQRRGQVVGTLTQAGRGFLWDNGVITDLGRLGNGGTAASDINNAGQVVGSSSSTHGHTSSGPCRTRSSGKTA